MLTITLSIPEWALLFFTMFLSMKASQQGGVAYGRGQNWMPETAISTILFFGAVFYALYFGEPTAKDRAP